MLLVSLSNPKNKPFVGKRMSELIAARGGDPIDVFFDVLIEEGGLPLMIAESLAESVKNQRCPDARDRLVVTAALVTSRPTSSGKPISTVRSGLKASSVATDASTSPPRA